VTKLKWLIQAILKIDFSDYCATMIETDHWFVSAVLTIIL
jgi:hypothetical protein